VFAGNTTSALMSFTGAVKDGVSGATTTSTATSFQLCAPAPGAIALLGFAGLASGRRRR
jgi:hypothetical protein